MLVSVAPNVNKYRWGMASGCCTNSVLYIIMLFLNPHDRLQVYLSLNSFRYTAPPPPITTSRLIWDKSHIIESCEKVKWHYNVFHASHIKRHVYSMFQTAVKQLHVIEIQNVWQKQGSATPNIEFGTEARLCQ